MWKAVRYIYASCQEKLDRRRENSACHGPYRDNRAKDRLISITQGRRSVRDYNADFREQLLLSGATLDREYQIAQFRRGLNAKLQKLLVSYEPLTYTDIVGKATKTSDELYRANVLFKGKS